jgi:tripartite-type tricarboxylate transporter receptor subunit TctC
MRSFVDSKVAAGLALIVLAYLSAVIGANALDYPTRVITLVVPYAPGGGVDAMARIVAAKLSNALKQQVIVDNRGGGGGILGTFAVARAEPNGYTLLLGHTGTISIIPNLHVHAGYDPRKDFAPIGLIASMPMALVTKPSFPATSIADIMAIAKKQPGALNLGTSGSAGYLCGELFKAAAGIDVAIIRYRGTASLMNDLVGGHVPVAFSVLPPALGNIRAGNLRAIALTSSKRSSLLPDVPTLDELGLTGFEAVVHFGLLAPAGTSKEIIDRLSFELQKLVQSDDVKQRIYAEGGDPLTSTPDEYAVYVDKEETKWRGLMRKLNLKLE